MCTGCWTLAQSPWHCICYPSEGKGVTQITCVACCRWGVTSCSPRDCGFSRNYTTVRPCGTCPVSTLCNSVLPLVPSDFESQISSLLCSRTAYVSRWIVRAWHLLVTEPSVKRNLQLTGIALYYGKNAKSHDWHVSSCQPDLTAFALTYVMHYLLLITTLDWVRSLVTKDNSCRTLVMLCNYSGF